MTMQELARLEDRLFELTADIEEATEQLEAAMEGTSCPAPRRARIILVLLALNVARGSIDNLFTQAGGLL